MRGGLGDDVVQELAGRGDGHIKLLRNCSQIPQTSINAIQLPISLSLQQLIQHEIIGLSFLMVAPKLVQLHINFLNFPLKPCNNLVNLADRVLRLVLIARHILFGHINLSHDILQLHHRILARLQLGRALLNLLQMAWLIRRNDLKLVLAHLQLIQHFVHLYLEGVELSLDGLFPLS